MFDNVGSYPLEISGILLITPLLPRSKHTFGLYEISPSGENLKNQSRNIFSEGFIAENV